MRTVQAIVPIATNPNSASKSDLEYILESILRASGGDFDYLKILHYSKKIKIYFSGSGSEIRTVQAIVPIATNPNSASKCDLEYILGSILRASGGDFDYLKILHYSKKNKNLFFKICLGNENGSNYRSDCNES
jgi:hypothetical protein